MTVTCPCCVVHARPGQKWHGTGAFNQNRHGLRRAELVCDVCGYRWSSGLPAAIDAGAAERGDNELPPVNAPPVPVPQPSLPIPGLHVPTSQPFASTRALVEDFRRRQTGARE